MTWILYESKLKNISQTCNINHLQKRRWFFVIIYNPSETGRSLGTGSVLSMKMGVSVNGNTYGCGRRPEKRLFFWTGRCFLGRRPRKWAFFWPRRWKNKKRHPRKDVSVNIWQWDSSATLGMTLTRLLIKRSSNVNRTSNCTTNHWVVTDAEESHHLNVCWNRRQTEGGANPFVLPRCEGGKARRA